MRRPIKRIRGQDDFPLGVLGRRWWRVEHCFQKVNAWFKPLAFKGTVQPASLGSARVFGYDPVIRQQHDSDLVVG